ncbi:hypothetical protein [uncultured Rummeliibacillus sp.]|uniref:hypothetical protein n=1 Tax=uncultured Rummeliibacillus sp. TaxID=762292 RepID=UPI0026398B55|nr:hypothetical protein [uncultured Rummeliibacillus sp.]
MFNYYDFAKFMLVGVKFLKASVYGTLGIALYVNIIGPNELADILKIENPSKEGIKQIGIFIPNYVLYLTFGAVILEVLSNILEIPSTIKD